MRLHPRTDLQGWRFNLHILPIMEELTDMADHVRTALAKTSPVLKLVRMPRGETLHRKYSGSWRHAPPRRSRARTATPSGVAEDHAHTSTISQTIASYTKIQMPSLRVSKGAAPLRMGGPGGTAFPPARGRV
ncbi:MAG: hypothetical protein Alpg2KO_04710 [Alphaproteobacteria bacterium]